MENQLKQPIYKISGEKTGELNLPEDIFAQKISKKIISQTINSLRKNSRASLANAKDRSQVRGGGRKPWRQKGTGRARHGSIRSPIWKGGGVTHGPSSDKKYLAKINKKVKASTLKMALTGKLNDKEIVFVDRFLIEKPKTKEFATAIKRIIKERKNEKVLLIVDKTDKNIILASKNLPNISIALAKDINVSQLLSVKYLVLTKASLEVIKSRLS